MEADNVIPFKESKPSSGFAGVPMKSHLVEKAAELFDGFDAAQSNCVNDSRLSSYKLEQFSYNLSLGLSVVEAAYGAEMSATFIKQVYNGVGLSLSKLVDFAKAMTFARATMKAVKLGDIEKTDGVQAAVVFLEKAYSSKYGDRKIIDIQTGFADDDSDLGWSIEVHHVDNKIKESHDEQQLANRGVVKADKDAPATSAVQRMIDEAEGE